MIPLTEKQIQSWHTSRQRYLADLNPHPKGKNTVPSSEHQHDTDRRRDRVQKIMLDLLNKYRTENISIVEFGSDFKHYTRHGTVWDTFRLAGHSGSMYLDKLVEHRSDVPELDMRLKSVLQASASEQDANNLMQSFYDFMENTIKTSSDASIRKDLAPGRIPFFVSVWWHMQDKECWPIFYPCTRNAFEQEGLYKPISSSPTTDDYFTFREVFLELQTRLGWPSWEIEHVCDWMTRR